MAIYTLTINILSSPLHGSVTPPSGSTYDDAGSHTPTIEATADSGYKFQYWTGALSGRVNPQNLHMTSNLTVNAYFAEDRTQSHNLPDVPTISYDTDVFDNRQALNLPDVPTISYDTDVFDNRQALNLPTVPTISGVTAQTGVAHPDRVWLFDNLLGYTDYTTPAGDETANDVPVLPVIVNADDGLFIGHASKFQRVAINTGTVGTGTYTLEFKYWNGSAWTTLTTWYNSYVAGKTTNFLSFAFDSPSDWALKDVNGDVNYYITITYVSGAVTITSLASEIVIGIVSESTLYEPSYNESVTFTESIPKIFGKPFYESATFTESRVKAVQKSFSEDIQFTEVINTLMTRGGSVSENVTFSETISKTLIRPFAESINFTEVTSLDNAQYRFRDFVYFNEIINKTLYKYHLEYTPFTESISKRITKPLQDVVSFIENILQHRIINYRFQEYLNLYELAPRKTITHFIHDSLIKLDERVNKVLRSGSHIWFWHTDDRVYFNEYINKQIEKYETEQVEFDEDYSALIRRNKTILFWKMDRVRFKESFQKTIKVFKSEDVAFLMTYSKSNTYIIQDNATFIESFIKTVIKKVVDTVPFTEVTNTLLTVPLYFDAGRIEPRYVITDLRIYGGAEMQFYTGQTADIRWKHRRFDNDKLYDPDRHTITIYDSRNVQRVAFDVTQLLKESTGCYKYYFTLPSDVIVGDWYARITATKGTATTVLTIHFDVKER